LKAGDKAAVAPVVATAPAAKVEAKKTLAQVEPFYNNEAGFWMYDTTLIQGDDED
jgi:hypothetical protein